jgi:alpha-glucosidase
MKILILGLVSLFFVISCSRTNNESSVTNPTAVAPLSSKSPNGKTEFSFFLTEEGQPAYTFSFDNQLVIDKSLLGFEVKDLDGLAKGFKVVNSELTTFDETWEQPWGEERFIRNNYYQLRVSLQEIASAGKRLDIVFRVFDDALGFRYEFPKQSNLSSFEITKELTEFNLTGDHTSWWTPALAGEKYEYLTEKTPISEVKLVHTPLTMETESGLYIAIHEAALRNFSTMNLSLKSGNMLQAELVPWNKNIDVKALAKAKSDKTPVNQLTTEEDAELISPIKAYVEAPSVTPWRTIQVAEKAIDLITSYVALNLNDPNELGDVSWVKPGKYVGIWWEMHLGLGSWNSGENHAANTANVKKYIDFAEKNGFAGVLVEGWNIGWDGEWYNHAGEEFIFDQPYPDFDIEEISRYGKEKNVYLIGHHETGSDIVNYEKQIEAGYQFLEDHGAKAVKTGYVESGELLTSGHYHHGQYFVRHHEKGIKVAAKHKVMVVAHETIKDTGERRTFPNMISREVARGQEYNAWAQDGGNPPNHTAIIPFTRMLAGPMDFTPGIFDITLPQRPNNQVNTTLAKQLALYVVIYSPAQMAADLPENYKKQPAALQFIKDVGVDWETTVPLEGKIGEHIAIARKIRQGDDWFVGALTNENPRTTTIDLSFLDTDRKYTAKIYRDADDAHYKTNPTAYIVEEKIVTASDKLNIKLVAGGGVAISLFAQ